MRYPRTRMSPRDFDGVVRNVCAPPLRTKNASRRQQEGRPAGARVEVAALELSRDVLAALDLRLRRRSRAVGPGGVLQEDNASIPMLGREIRSGRARRSQRHTLSTRVLREDQASIPTLDAREIRPDGDACYPDSETRVEIRSGAQTSQAAPATRVCPSARPRATRPSS